MPPFVTLALASVTAAVELQLDDRSAYSANLFLI